MTPAATPAAPEAPHRLAAALTDTRVITWRNLKRIPRIPELAVFAVLQSIMFVVLFAFVFGGAIPLPGGGSYREYLLPGIFAQTIAFTAATTAVGIADDMTKGIMDRFRSLPMSPGAVVGGRALSDVIYNAVILAVLMVSGLAVGWRVHTSVMDFLYGSWLLLGFAFAMAWLGVWLGMLVRTPETANQVAAVLIFPLTFMSNVFVPTETMPAWLQPIAEWNPISSLTAATRELFGNPNPFPTGSFPSTHPVVVTVAWTVLIVAVFAPLSARTYRSRGH